MKTVYLDNSATTRPCETAVKYINNCLTENWGNPSSTYTLGIRAGQILNKAREKVAKTLHCDSKEIVFTGSGSEANNTAIFGGAYSNFRKGKKIVTTSIEHPSVLKALERLEKDGFEIVRLSPDKYGKVPLSSFDNAIDSETCLVTVMLVNNEIGSINDIKGIRKIIDAKSSPALFHCDAVQAFGKLPIDVKQLGVDMLSASGHKIHASKGIGFLYKSAKLHISPLIYGGGQEFGLRSGTESLPLIAGLMGAIEELPDLREQLIMQRNLYEYAKQRLSEVGCVVINSSDEGLPYVMNISVDGYKSETMLNALSEKNIFVSKGSACAKGHRSYVLSECGLAPDLIDSALRISFSRYNTEDDIDILTDAIKELTAKLRRFKR